MIATTDCPRDDIPRLTRRYGGGCDLSRDKQYDQLFDHLVQEFGQFGDSAVGFLVTATELLQAGKPERQPRLAEAISYCVREALKRILDSVERPGAGRWQNASRRVTSAKRRFVQTRGLPGGDEEAGLEELLHAIDELDDLHNEAGLHERRIIAVLVSRTGTVPLDARYKVVIEYQALIAQLNTAVHEDQDLDSARSCLDLALRLLGQLFSPPDVRLAELDELALIRDPTSDDAARLVNAIYAPSHLTYFFGRVVSVSWLELLSDSGIVTPPAGQAAWPVYRLVENLAGAAANEIAEWLNDAYERWGSDAVRAAYLTRAAADIGAPGHALLVRALRDHQQDSTICHTVQWALRGVVPSDRIVSVLADYLPNPESGLQRIAGIQSNDGLLAKLVEGLTVENATERLELLAYKLQSISADDTARRLALGNPAGSIAEPTEAYRDDPFDVLLDGFTAAINRVLEIGVSYDVVLAVLKDLDAELSSRIRAWVLSTAPGVALEVAVEEVAASIRARPPSGDDLPLIDKVVSEMEATMYIDNWRASLGAPPSPESIAAALRIHEVDPRWLISRNWAAILPAACGVDWRTTISLLAAAYGPVTRESFEYRPRSGAWTGQSPMTVKELVEMEPDDAANAIATWRPQADDRLTSARELARALEETIKREPKRWLRSPVTMIGALREPIYISHYFRAVSSVEIDVSSAADSLVEAIAFCRSHPWQPTVLGRDDWDYDPDWRFADEEGIRLLQKLADCDAGFGARREQAWTIVLEAARDRSEESSVTSPRDDPLQTAINRPCTKALGAAISLMAFEFRELNSVNSEGLNLLDQALRLGGWEGAEHRAIIAPRLGFLLHVARDWIDEHADLIVGSEAPDDLGQLTVDLAVKWGRPQRWVFERVPDRILNAVGREVDNALTTLLVGMLWRIAGYEPSRLVDQLSQMGSTLISSAGEALGRLLRSDDADEEHIRIGVEFWEEVLSRQSLDQLGGFGWWAEVRKLAEPEWEHLTVATARRMNGRVDWSHAVAERGRSATCFGRRSRNPKPTRSRSSRRVGSNTGHGDWGRRAQGGKGPSRGDGGLPTPPHDAHRTWAL